MTAAPAVGPFPAHSSRLTPSFATPQPLDPGALHRTPRLDQAGQLYTSRNMVVLDRDNSLTLVKLQPFVRSWFHPPSLSRAEDGG